MKHIEVISDDRIGLVGEISKVIRRADGNIITHNADVITDGSGAILSHFIADVELDSMTDTEPLLRRLRRIRDVRQVSIKDL